MRAGGCLALELRERAAIGRAAQVAREGNPRAGGDARRIVVALAPAVPGEPAQRFPPRGEAREHERRATRGRVGRGGHGGAIVPGRAGGLARAGVIRGR